MKGKIMSKTEKNFNRRVREVETKMKNLLLEAGGAEEVKLRRKVESLEKRLKKIEAQNA